MGATAQQAPSQSTASPTGAVVDLVKVLYEPDAVFERVRERPRFLVPFLVLAAIQVIVGIVNMPFLKAAISAQAAARGAPAGGPDPASFAWIGLIFVPIALGIALVLGGFVLWMLVSLMGGDAKFRTLLSVATYASLPTVALLALAGTAVLRLQGVSEIASPADMQPSLGLDLLVPATGFAGAVLKGINPFGLWGMVLTAIGASVTHRLARGTGYTVAAIAFLIGLLILGAFGALQG